jgi:methyl-accepting chemotaxis protein
MSAVERVTGVMNEIEASALEQSDGIEQVNKAVSQIDEVTQHNAALVEEAAAAAKSLEEQATILRDAVAVFQMA